MSDVAIRAAESDDRAAIDALVAAAFPTRAEADLVAALAAAGDFAAGAPRGRLFYPAAFAALG